MRGPFRWSDSALEMNVADLAFDVPASWQSAIRDADGNVVAVAIGEAFDAEEAYQRAVNGAREIAEALNARESSR